MTRAAILSAFNPEAFKGGIETFILNLSALLSERNIQVDTHFMSPTPSLKIEPFPLKTLKTRVPEFLLNCFMLGRAFSKIEKEYDFVISNNFYGLGYFSPRVKGFNIYHSTHAAYADALKGKLQEKDYRDLRYFYGYLGDWLSGRGKVKIAVSEAVRNELGRYYKYKEVQVVNHGIDTAFFRKMEKPSSLREKWRLPGDSFIGIFVGRWEIGKGIDIMEEVIRLHHDIFWILVIGPSECPLPETNRVRVIRNTDRADMRELYSLSDFMILPSYYEGFGLAIIEAMSCELPVICPQVGVAGDLPVRSTLQSLLIPSCPPKELHEEISHRIAFLKKNMSERAAIGTAGRSIIQKDYTLESWKRRMASALGLAPERRSGE